MFMVASGSHVGHAAVALWENDQLWIVESQSASYFASGKDGVQKNKYSDWIRYSKNADYEVAWL